MRLLLGGCGGMMATGVLGAGFLMVGDEAVGGMGGVKEGRGDGGAGAKNPGGGIPGGRAGKLMGFGAGGKGGVMLRGKGTGATRENGVFALDASGGMLWGSRPTSAGVSSTNPTEPGKFFDELPP
ncbi:MAG: hypothetical protein EAZ78_14865 [Oscillatoriales cyanobacterium]|nr:MAG: hypothetical protein EA000_16070 [Oscillatoriales cyanobacterium]TAD95375.1 MAG: hypothetical protein EAZ98_15935 [Oscillatoriales cyanobacterium]TAE04857.1 MAG: hypothetical protein EAZ96_07530 [Oscillatoriales cyanobacterium]TAF02625.1 MAG: hypothetical protein EAZ78_14865 [Oscillatoriales cyanobacterium]TAF70899.1 MAG: hypothetical protein EAZ59_03025 [Oscillatoriales cyanobacterium]